MTPVMDSGNLIACSSCAKAKAKCDKQLPTCSRCLYKRLKCEPRPPRRYPDTFHFLQSQAQPTQTPPPSTSPSPPDHGDSTTEFSELFSSNSDINFTQPAGAFELQWHQPPLSAATVGACPGDLSMDSLQPNVQQFDPRALGDFTPFSAEDTVMDYAFASENFGFQIPRVQTPSLSFKPSPPPASQTTAHKSAPLQPPQDRPGSATDEDWPCFQCNPSNAQPINPKIGSHYLKRLEDTLNDQSVWHSAQYFGQSPTHQVGIDVEPVEGSLRDKLMVISQGFLSRARDVHRTGSDDTSLGRYRSSSSASITGFFILPPPPVLEAFLSTYASRVEPYIPFFSAGAINLTQLIASNDEKSSILLLLLMIAHGAMGSASPDARNLAGGLIETCRICMFDIMEKNVQMSAHPIMLRCALLYLSAAAWSGNKWHMDLSAAQFRMYLSMLRHARMFDTRKSSLVDMESMVMAETAWKVWQTEETLNRLTYSWVTLDQEMNLFHDRQPDLDINELNAPVPDSDELWSARSVEVWQRLFIEGRQLQNTDARHSLAKLFNSFMSNELATSMSLTELRLLLHPLQALMYHLNKSVVYFFNSGSQRLLQRLMAQLEEVQYLLRQWYTICRTTLDQSDIVTPNGCSSLVMFHLISLNAITYFPDIERLARGEIPPETFRESLWAGKRCSEEASQIWSHCGQVIRHFRQMPAVSRPYWWGASIYRIALCMWATSLSSNTKSLQNSASGAEQITIDSLPFDHPLISRYLRHGEGSPVLSRSDGSLVSLHTPIDSIRHCIGLLNETESGSLLDEGISARLAALIVRWTI